MASSYVAGGALCVGMEFSDREAIVQVIKDYNISKSVDYKVFKSEPTTFHCKFKHFSRGCEWLVRIDLRKKKDVRKIRKYNSPHTYTVVMISQGHIKLDTDMIAQHIAPLVQADSSYKVKLLIAAIQSQFRYTISY